MDKQTALTWIGLIEDTPNEVIQEVITEKIFEIKNYLLRNPIVKQLHDSRKKKLLKYAQIGELFGLKFSETKPQFVLDLSFKNDLLGMFESYESALSVLKLNISATDNPSEIAEITDQLIRVQMHYEENFNSIGQQTGIEPLEETVKSADQLDSGVVIFKLKTKGLESVLPALQKEMKRIQLLIS